MSKSRENRIPKVPVKRGWRRKVATEDIKNLYEKGLSMSEVAKRFGMTRSGVQSRFQREGYKPRPPKKYRVTTDELAELCLGQGLSCVQASQSLDLGMTSSAIHRRLKKAGYKLPKGQRPRKVSLKKMITDYADFQLNIQEVAKRAGVSPMTAYNRLRQADVPMRTRWEGTKISLARKREERAKEREELLELRAKIAPVLVMKPPQKPPHRPRKDEEAEQVDRLRVEGLSWKQIAINLNRNKQKSVQRTPDAYRSLWRARRSRTVTMVKSS